MPAMPETPAPVRHAALIARAIAWVDTHLDQPLSAAVLADRAAMSRHHFHRVFAACVGCSVADFVLRRRLQRACALLVSGDEPVLDVALSVGYDSAQSLAKAMRRELDTTPTKVRAGDEVAWSRLFEPGIAPPRHATRPDPMISPVRHATLPDGITALTATARGMVGGSLTRAAAQAFGELATAVTQAGHFGAIRSCIAQCPDEPKGPDDPDCRYVGGAIFGYVMADGSGACARPAVPLTGSLAWADLSPGAYAVFLHRGAYEGLGRTWTEIYRDWVPANMTRLRDAPPLELTLNDVRFTPSDQLLTEIWIPVRQERPA